MTYVQSMGEQTYDAQVMMRTSKATIQQDPNSSALLTYSALVTPDPLQVSDAGTITLVVSNSTHQAITCTSIAVTLPIGTNAKDLISTASGIQTQLPTNWEAASSSGVITFTPQTADAGKITGDGLSFIIANLAVNAQPGTCTVTITETASSPSQPAEPRTATFSVPKFPALFQVSDLQTNGQFTVPVGGSVTLTWSGSPSSPNGTYTVTYTLDFQPGNSSSLQVTQTVSNVGPYSAQDLTRDGSVDFTLIVKVSVPGQDDPLIVQRYASVAVETMTLSFNVAPPSVGVNGLVHASWTTANAMSCTLDPGGGTIPTSGDLYMVLAQTRTYTLTAYGATGVTPLQQQFTVTVDPTIQPNIAGQQIIGQQGGYGGDGQSGWGYAGGGGNGGPGGDAILTVTLPPLDVSSTPARVMPITLIGGNAGNGGNGGNDIAADPGPMGPGGNGGSGGAGGNASLTATFDPSVGAPAQYIITMSAGRGGSAGNPGSGTSSGGYGGNGSNGGVTMTFNGVP